MDKNFSEPFPPAAEQDIDFRPYIRLLWQKRFALLGAAALGAIIAAGFILMIPPKYAAEVSIGAGRPSLAGGSVDATSVTNVLPFISSVAIAAQVINEFHLDRPPYLASPSSFFTRTLTVAPQPTAGVVTISGTFRDPELIAKVLNRVADLGVAAVQRAVQRETTVARNTVDTAQKQYDDATSQLLKFEDTAQVDMVRMDADEALKKRRELQDLSIEIEAKKAMLAQAEQELAGRSRVDTVHRSIDSDPAILDVARGAGASNPLQLSLKSEVIDPVFQKLDEDIATGRTDLAGLERERAQLTGQNLDGAKLKQFDLLYKSEIELDRLKNQQQAAEKNYLQAVAASDPERLGSGSQAAVVQIVAPATPPTVPEPRHMAPLTLAGFVAGFFVGAFFVIVRYLMQPVPIPR